MKIFSIGLLMALVAPCLAQPGQTIEEHKAPVASTPEADESGSAGAESERTRKVELLHSEAVALFKLQQFKAALERFEEAKQLLPDPVLAFNIGRCREALGELQAAETAYEEAAASPDAQPGLRARAKARGEAVRATMTAIANTKPVEAPALAVQEPVDVEPESSSVWAWSLLGVGAAVTIVGGVGVYNGFEKHSELEDAVRGSSGKISRVKAQALDEDGSTYKLWGGAILGLGVALITVGAILSDGDGEEEDDDDDGISIGLMPAVDGAHGFIGWEF